ncbi:CAF17-like 4Fe-4S cluster assembly/insertion protein YgfZ [Thermaurantiacus sp.]
MPLAHLSSRAVLKLSGMDARTFLQGMITADIGALAPGRPLWSGLLSPQGKALFAFFLHQEGDDILVDVAASVAEALKKRLMMFRLRKDVAIAPTDLAVFAAWGPDSSGRPADPRLSEAGARWIAAPGSATPDADEAAYDRHRIALGLPDQPEIGQDMLLWLETNARELNGVSFTKGCYVGQENTARMHHRDKIRKRLLPLQLPVQPAGPLPDTRVMAGEREAGEVRGTPVGGVALALLRTELVREPLSIAGTPVTFIQPSWLAEG